MKIALIVAVACVVATLPSVKGDSPASPFPWVTTSERGNYLFKMVPPKWRNKGESFVIDREAFGIAYKITEKGEFQ